MSTRTAIRWLVVAGLVAALCWMAVAPPWRSEASYRAEFAHASGVRVGEEVRVAGIPVGEVTSVSLDRDQVVIDFTAADVEVTQDSHVAVKLASTLGQHYLELRPGTGEPLRSGEKLPMSNTESPFTLDAFFPAATRSLEELDLAAMAEAVDTLASNLDGAPEVTGAALEGITRLSTLVATRDEQIGRLLAGTRTVTDVVRSQQGNLTRLVDDADLVLAMIADRREQIRLLLRDTRAMVLAVGAIVDDNQAKVGPMLADLETVLTTLTRNARHLDRTVRMMGPVSRYYANASGNGPWVDVYSPTFIFPDTISCPVIATAECLR